VPCILGSNGELYSPYAYKTESEFEQVVGQLASKIFGPQTLYLEIKKQVKGGEIISIPDAYLLDFTNIVAPKLYVIENEIVSHDPFKHIGIQLLRFATSFNEGKHRIRQFLMEEIQKDPSKVKVLQECCNKAGQRNVDSYLDLAVLKEFSALVVIDEARPELHNVLKQISAVASVIELKTFRAANGQILHQFDTLYDEYEEVAANAPVQGTDNSRAITELRSRRATCDTIVVPAKDDGFYEVFIGENRWYKIRIGAAMKDKIKYIAAYQVAPVSAITYLAEVQEIKPYEDTGKYQVIFKAPAVKIKPVPLGPSGNALQGPTYVKKSDLMGAENIDELLN